MFVSRTQSAATCTICGLLHAAFGTQITAKTAVSSTYTAAIVCGPFTRVRDMSSLQTFTSALASSRVSFRPRFCVHSFANYPHRATIVARVYHPVRHRHHLSGPVCGLQLQAFVSHRPLQLLSHRCIAASFREIFLDRGRHPLGRQRTPVKPATHLSRTVVKN